MLNFVGRTASVEAGAKSGGKVLGRVPYYFVAALLWAAVVVQPSFAFAANDPRQCILEAGGAVDKSDVAAFERQVDVDAILEQALNLFVRRAQDPEAAKDLPPMAQGSPCNHFAARISGNPHGAPQQSYCRARHVCLRGQPLGGPCAPCCNGRPRAIQAVG